MPAYASKEEFVRILSVLWERIFETPELVENLARTKLVVRFRYPDYGTDFYIDSTGSRPQFYWDPEPPVDCDVDMILSSDTCHAFWMQTINVPLALASRKIVAKGSVQKALRLLPALKPAFRLYPDVLRDLGRHDLLETKERARKRRRRPLFRPIRRADYDLSLVPNFPMTFPDERPPKPAESPRRSAAEVSDVDLLRTMWRIRCFEEHLAQAFREGNLPTEAIHLSIGQEGIAAGVCTQLRDSDYLNTTHRGHGHLIGKGADLRRMMAEIYGKETGQCGGKGGSMHVTDATRGILGANGIVGAGYLLAMGAAWTIKRQRRDDVSVIIAGDGSVNQGMFHEALNMMTLFELPVLIVVENNLYGEFTPIERHSAVTKIHRRAESYNIESVRMDGNDVKSVYKSIRNMLDAIRADGKPRLVEMMTYRWRGHMEGEPESYRSTEEKERFRNQDPIARLESDLLEDGVATQDTLGKIHGEALREVRDAVAFALESPDPPSSALLTHVYTPDDKRLHHGALPAPEDVGRCRDISVAQAINEAIAEEMAADERVFLWGEDVTLGGYFNVTDGLLERFGPERIVDTPISENAIVGGAVGAAVTGMRPVVEILFSDFLTCCMDPVFNQAAKLRYMTGGQVSIPLTIRTPLGSGIGMAAQHSQSMEKYFFGMPGLIVAAPSDAYTAKGLLKSAIRSNNPVLFFEHKLLYGIAGKVPEGDYTLPLGKARIVRAGEDVTIVTHLLGVSVALDAAGILEGMGTRVEVVDLATLYPLDTATILESVKKTRRLVTLEEGTATGGIGAEVIARCAAAGHGLLRAAPVRIAAPECPIPYARNLENAMLATPEGVAEQVAAMFGRP